MTPIRLWAGLLALLALAVGIFVLFPGSDMTVAAHFALGGGHFVGDTKLGRGVRFVGEYLPVSLLGLFALLYGAKRLFDRRVWAPTGVGLIMMAASLALGPGLLVNTLLKDHSHRPRPVQVAEFGGPYAFRPFYRFDGGCVRNCSFVSGEGSTAFWTLAPALLAPPPYRAAAVAAALLFGVTVATLRMAFGGHFLSDTVFAALFAWLVILACWRGIVALTGRDLQDPARPPAGEEPSRATGPGTR